MEDYKRESVVEFDGDTHLVAIATEPAKSRANPGVVILNAGVLHRVGPHRLHVRLARRLAGAGFVTVRVDLSGIGDSRAVPGDLDFRDSAVADTRQLIDRLGANGGPSRYVLFGVCAGADNALATALIDARVEGVVLIDPAAYASPQARLREALRKLRSNGAVGALKKSAAALRRRLAPATARTSEAAAQSARQPPPAALFGAELGQLADRGVRILMIYSGALSVRYNHPQQLFETFPALRGRVEVAFFPDANHTFTERAAQAALLNTVQAWFGKTFPPAAL